MGAAREMGTIFINYRRDDSQGASFSLQAHLARHFGKRKIFLDIHGLDAGAEFDLQLDKQVAACSAMIVMIGPYWLKTLEDGTRRIDGERDFVRLEIAKALHLRKPILPVLVGEAKMPASDDLPESIRDVTRYNGRPLRFERFEADAEEIANALRQMVRRQGMSPWWLGAAAAAGFAAALPIGPWAVQWAPSESWKPNWHRMEIAELNGDVEREKEVNARLSQQIATLTDARDEARKQRDAALIEAGKARTDDAELRRRLQERTDELLAEKKARESAQADIDTIIRRLREERDRAAEDRRRSVQLGAEAERLTRELDDTDRQLRELIVEYDERKRGFSAETGKYHEEIARLNREVAEARAAQKAEAERAGDLEHRLTEAAGRIEDLTAARAIDEDRWVSAAEHADVADRLAALQGKYDTLVEDRAASEVRLASLSAETAGYQDRIAALEAKLAETERELAASRQRVAELEAERKVIATARAQACNAMKGSGVAALPQLTQVVAFCKR